MTADPLLTTLDLPRANGELVFAEPWQARALGLGVAAMRALGVGAVEWRDELAAAIERHGYDPAEDPAAAYYSAWIDALERVVDTRGIDT
jgi:nitrile hydratase accessory protein